MSPTDPFAMYAPRGPVPLALKLRIAADMLEGESILFMMKTYGITRFMLRQYAAEVMDGLQSKATVKELSTYLSKCRQPRPILEAAE